MTNMTSPLAPSHPDTSETITVTTTKLHCDGLGGALGHPRVFLTMGPNGKIDCPYCGKHYVLAAGAEADHH